MSELTSPIRIDIPGVGSIESADLYLKSEADREIRKQKRRRCLAMAGRCDDKATIYRLLIDGESIKINPCPYFIKRYRKEKELFEKWRKRWLEIADKFKEAV